MCSLEELVGAGLLFLLLAGVFEDVISALLIVKKLMQLSSVYEQLESIKSRLRMDWWLLSSAFAYRICTQKSRQWTPFFFFFLFFKHSHNLGINILKPHRHQKQFLCENMLPSIKNRLGRGHGLPCWLPMVHVENNEPLKTWQTQIAWYMGVTDCAGLIDSQVINKAEHKKTPIN